MVQCRHRIPVLPLHFVCDIEVWLLEVCTGVLGMVPSFCHGELLVLLVVVVPCWGIDRVELDSVREVSSCSGSCCRISHLFFS